MIKKEIKSFFYAKCDEPGCTKTVAYPFHTDVPLPGTKFCFTLDTLLTYMKEKENWLVVRIGDSLVNTYCDTHSSNKG